MEIAIQSIDLSESGTLYLYYQDIQPDFEPELVGKYKSLDKLLSKIKQICNDSHEELPECNPTYEEYIAGNFTNYPIYNTYSFYLPTEEELKNNYYITIISECDEYYDYDYKYLVSRNSIETNELISESIYDYLANGIERDNLVELLDLINWYYPSIIKNYEEKEDTETLIIKLAFKHNRLIKWS